MQLPFLHHPPAGLVPTDLAPACPPASTINPTAVYPRPPAALQGEADADEEAHAAAYGANFTAFAAAVRRDLAPFHAQVGCGGCGGMGWGHEAPYVAQVGSGCDRAMRRCGDHINVRYWLKGRTVCS